MEVIERQVEVEPGVNLATWLIDGRPKSVIGVDVEHTGPAHRIQATFLLVHGLASNSRLWDFTALELARLGHLVAAMDLRGHGTSDKPDHGYDFQTLTSDITTVSDALGLSAPILGGQSLGANLVLEAAFLHPQRFRGIACVDGGAIELSESFPEWEDAKKVLTPPKLVGTKSDVMIEMIRGAHPSWPESGIQATMANFYIRDDNTVAPRLSLDNHLRLLRSLWEHKPSGRFAALMVPALFVFAGGPGSGPPGKRQSAERAEALVPSVSVEWFDNADHDIHAQHPVELAALFDLKVQQGFFAPDSRALVEDRRGDELF
jgi:pimeloyl-ACP methyl ester carboxylesterase